MIRAGHDAVASLSELGEQGLSFMFEAARFGDEISHTSALGGFLIGAALGIALVATVAIATFTCGFGVALLAGLAAGIGGSLLTAAGEAIGSMFSSPSGTITTASPNVFINSRKAARVEKSIGACDKHPGPVQIAEGSTNVFINSVAAARKGEDDIALGHVLGAGLFNTLAVAGLAGLIEPLDVETTVLVRDLAVMAALALGLYWVGRDPQRPTQLGQTAGRVLVAVYLLHTAALIVTSGPG